MQLNRAILYGIPLMHAMCVAGTIYIDRTFLIKFELLILVQIAQKTLLVSLLMDSFRRTLDHGTQKKRPKIFKKFIFLNI